MAQSLSLSGFQGFQQLDHEISLLTTFNTPNGRYRWLTMPFGLSTEYQRRQDKAVEGLPGIHSFTNYIFVYSEGDTEEAIVDHDRK